LGLFYSLITTHLGFEPNSDEYRVMALAALGDPHRYSSTMSEAMELRPRGRVRVSLLESDASDPHREQYRRGRAWLADRTFAVRGPGEGLDPNAADLAASAQRRLEQAIAHVLDHWMSETGLTRVAMAGGVALNCVANGRSFEWGVTDLFVQPAAGDEGTALGAALAAIGPEDAEVLPPMPYLGPDIDIDAGPLDLGSPSGRARIAAAAANLGRGAVIGWAHGRLEFGPRALGNRSILADPRSASTRDRVNAAVKFREGFRPLAPVVLAERASEYFVIPAGATAAHMTAAFAVRPEVRDQIPAVVHSDGTARVQVVDRAQAPLLAALLDDFDRLTGVPVLLNTSLNVKGQPMAARLADAIWTYENSAMDLLYAGAQVFTKDHWATSSGGVAPR
jgi:carbamoyltransferase